MANKIQVKRSAIPSKVPTTSDLDLGEIAINTYDGIAYIKKDNGTPSIVPLGGGSGTGDVVGPTSATDNAIARFDNTTGKLIKNSAVTISDAGQVVGVTSILNTNYVDFDTTYATALTEGQLGWDGNNTLGLGMAGGNVTQHIGEDQFFYIKASSAITKGQVIMFTGAVGASGVPKGEPASGVTDGTYIMGIAAESIALNGFGLVQSFGTLRNVNTTGYADGDILWYNPAVAGGLTKTQPVAPNVKVQMAAVINGGSSGGGTILVRVNSGSTLGGTDSNAQITSPTNGNLLTYDGGNGYWKNTNLTAGQGISVAKSSNGVLTVSASLPSPGKVLYVSNISGNDTNDGSYSYPFLTISKALSVAGNTGYLILLFPSTTAYDGNTITNKNLTIASLNLGGGALVTVGATDFAHTSSSVRILGVNFPSGLTFSSTGNLYTQNCYGTNITLSGGGYFNSLNDDFVAGAVSVTGAGLYTFSDSSLVGPVTINNAAAVVVFTNTENIYSITVTAGTAALNNSVVSATTVGGYAVSVASGGYLQATNSQFVTTTGAAGILNLATGSLYNFSGVYFTTTGSVLNGTNLGSRTIYSALSLPLTGYLSGTGIGNSITASTTIPGSAISGVVGLANGGTGQTTANASFNALAPSQTGNSGKYLTTNGTSTSWGSPVGGSTTQVQYNSSGVLAGSANMTFSGTALTLANDASISSLTVGKGGGSVSTNTVFGNAAMAATASGGNNTAVGSQALTANTSGNGNVGVGSAALISNQTGNQITAVGYAALQLSTGVGSCTAIGYFASRQNTTGVSNTSMGTNALTSNQTGSSNVAIGVSALQSVTGSQNTALGTNAGKSGTNDLTTGSNNILIGYNASASSATISNEITIGNSSCTSLRLAPLITGYTSAAPTIASAATIAPTKPISFVSGTTTIDNITAPAPISSGGGSITLIPTGLFATSASGNIAIATTAVVGKALILTYDSTTTKWYPSY